jgi:hypothetical protein
MDSNLSKVGFESSVGRGRDAALEVIVFKKGRTGRA